MVSSLLPVLPNNCNGIVQSYSNSTSSRVNTIINFVPQQEAWVIERMGRYVKTLSPVNTFLFVEIIKMIFSRAGTEFSLANY